MIHYYINIITSKLEVIFDWIQAIFDLIQADWGQLPTQGILVIADARPKNASLESTRRTYHTYTGVCPRPQIAANRDQIVVLIHAVVRQIFYAQSRPNKRLGCPYADLETPCSPKSFRNSDNPIHRARKDLNF